MMQDLLSVEMVRRRGLFDPHAVQRLIGEHMSGRKDHWHKLWALMMLEMWQSGAAGGIGN
jgi:asparagine synthase (glutamine-hydrolysing)